MKELNVQKQTKNYKEMGSDNVKRRREGENEGKGGRQREREGLCVGETGTKTREVWCGKRQKENTL